MWDPDLIIVGLWLSVDFVPNKETVELRFKGSQTLLHISSWMTLEIHKINDVLQHQKR